MFQFNDAVQIITVFYLLYLSIEIADGCGCGKDSTYDYDSPITTPTKMQPPKEKKRTQKECDEYKANILATLPPNARKEDPNFIITGQVCADGLGSIYEA